MDHRNLINQINQLYSYANEAGPYILLHKLLKETIGTGSRDSFLVFLDLLEESDSKSFKELQNSENLNDIFKTLNHLFPDLIRIKHYWTSFAKPHFGDFLEIFSSSEKKCQIRYENFTAYFGNPLLGDEYRRIEIHANNPLFAYRDVITSITRIYEDSFNIKFEGDASIHDHLQVDEDTEQYKYVNKIFDAYQKKTQQSFEKIKNVFAIPGSK